MPANSHAFLLALFRPNTLQLLKHSAKYKYDKVDNALRGAV